MAAMQRVTLQAEIKKRMIRKIRERKGGVMKTKVDQEAKKRAADVLRKYFRPGNTAFTQLLHVSSSGMSRHIAVVGARIEQTRDRFTNKKRRQPVPVNLSKWVADLLGYRMNQRCDGLVVGGCGMDMGFHVVYSMSAALYPKGTKKPHSFRNGEPDTDGGYAVNHRWL